MKRLNNYSRILNWRNAVLILMVFIQHAIFCQEKFSPRLRKDVSSIDVADSIFSVSVKDTMLFSARYKSKVYMLKRYGKTYILSIKTQNDIVIKEMKTDDNVIFIDRHRKAVEEASIDFANLAFNRITKAHHSFPELLKASPNVSIKEQGFDAFNIDLINRSFSTSVTPILTSQHATAMATRIAGGGNSSLSGTGVAPAGRITSSDFQNLLPDADHIFMDNDIHLQNHSYGVGIENYYGNEAVAYDQQVFEIPTLVHVFSVGNLGQSVPEDGVYKNLNHANLSGNFKQAKNVILVNAVDTLFVVNELNSRGPAYDGRLKPELTAYGQGGTSEAAALVTGVSALLQSKYHQVNSELALASDIKAILIASADDGGIKGVDFTYGYGSVNAYKAIQLVELRQNVRVTLTSLQQTALPITVPSAVSELRVAVVWTDVQASPNASEALVNDIDSYIEAGGNQYLPWTLSTVANTDSLTAPAKRNPDHLNTVEYLTINNPEHGQYQLVIKASELATTSQIVSVAYWMEEKKSFQWDYPSGSDVMKANKKQTLYWDYDSNQAGELSYQLNEGEWIVVKSNTALDSYFHWTPPDTLSKARLKMKLGLEEFLSDEFLISPQQTLNVGYNCDDDFLLTWNSIQGVDSYKVYALGDEYLEEIADVSDTTFALSKSSGNFYFSVAPSFNTLTGLKSNAINYATQGSLCYINLFEAIRYDADQVEIHLNLSTLIHIDHIVIYKSVNDQQRILTTYDALKSQQLTVYDRELISGWMNFEAEIFLTDGTSLKSDISKVFIESKGKATLFPNPVTNDSDLTVVTEGGGLKFKILDCQGKLLFVKKLDLINEQLDLSDLPPGLYLYQLEEENQIKDSGKFIKL